MRILKEFGPGDFFGELALLQGGYRTASVVAVGHCHLYRLARQPFEAFGVVYPSWWADIKSENGVLRTKLRNNGIALSRTTSITHGLQLPCVEGIAASTLLAALETPAAEGADAIPEDRKCACCMDKEKCMFFFPCRHVATCEDCQPRLTDCPMCRAPIESFYRAYL